MSELEKAFWRGFLIGLIKGALVGTIVALCFKAII